MDYQTDRKLHGVSVLRMTKRKRSVEADAVEGKVSEKPVKSPSNNKQKRPASAPTPSGIKSKHSNEYEVTDEEHDTAVRLLREINWGKCQNTSRRNVIRLGDPKTPKNSVGKEYCHSFIFGKNMKDSTGGLSYWSTEYKDLYDFFQGLIGRVHPEHPYTNITVNKNLVCKKHTDGGNTGRSYIISFGTFTGGRLIIEKKGGGDPKVVDIYRKFVGFDGSTQPHETEAYDGERYSAVFYTSNIIPSETVPRKRALTLSAAVASAEAAAGSGSGGAAVKTEAGSAHSAAMLQKFKDMKKKLQNKVK